MKCPNCNNPDTKVVDSRAHEENTVIRRRRLCEACKNRFTTYERASEISLAVRKRDGTLEPYERSKIKTGILRSLTKRPISDKKIEELLDEIENVIIPSQGGEIKSKLIGEVIMEKLKELDEVAYVRFASVYREFRDVSTFINEVKKLISEKKTDETE